MNDPSSPSGPGSHAGDIPFAAHRMASTDGSRFPWPADIGGPKCDKPDVPHLGVLFVHGVGYQLSGEIFNSNTARIVRFIREAMYPDDPLRDPVRYGTRSVGWNQQPLIEIELPVVAKDGTRSVVHWVLSEAYWAATFEPPDLPTVAEWLGPGQGAARAARRLRYPGRRTGDQPSQEADPPGAGIGAYRALISVAVAVILGVYSLLRGLFAIIPIQALRTALIGPIDRFLTQWAGDMRIMLLDESQASIIRDRIARAAKALEDFGCAQTVVIAHSGGVVSTYMTLTDPLYNTRLKITRYITYGQGLAVAWRLLDIDRNTNTDVSSRVAGRLADPLPKGIKWDNYWATDDPVPAGPIDDPPPAARRARNIRVDNAWSTREDHNAYFDNDEGFVQPVVASLWEAVPGEGWEQAVARAGGREVDELAAAGEGERQRRQSRVAVHSMWGHVVNSVTAIAILGAVLAGLIGYWTRQADVLTRPLDDVTTVLSSAWASIPGTSVLKEPIDYLHSLDLWWLSVIGYGFWTAILSAAVWFLLRPAWRDWWFAAGGRAWQRLATVVVTLLAGFAGLLAIGAGIPGLLGVSIASIPWWRTEWPQEVLNRGIRQWAEGWAADPNVAAIVAGMVRNFVMFLALALAAVIVVLGVRLIRRFGPSQARLLGLAAYQAGLILILVGAAYAAIASRGFGSNILGWVLAAILLAIVGKIGDWRWHQWDHQERWEARATLRGGEKRRRFGRWLDLVIFAIAGIGVTAIGVGIAIRPLELAGANGLIVAGLALAGSAILIGGAQDYVNQETPTAPGMSPTDVPTAASRAL